MATVAEIQRAGLVKQDGYDHFYKLQQEYAQLSHARCYAFTAGHYVEESASDIERTGRVLKRIDFIYPNDEERERIQLGLFQEHDAYFAASLPSHLNGPFNIDSHVSGKEDMSLVAAIDANNMRVAETMGLPTTYAECAASGDTESDWAHYLHAKDITYDR